MLGMLKEDRKLIIEMHQDMKWLKDEVTKVRTEAQSEVGYKRCVAHKEQLSGVKEDQENLKKSFRWIRNTMVGGLISTVVAGCAAAVSYFFKS